MHLIYQPVTDMVFGGFVVCHSVRMHLHGSNLNLGKTNGCFFLQY